RRWRALRRKGETSSSRITYNDIVINRRDAYSINSGEVAALLNLLAQILVCDMVVGVFVFIDLYHGFGTIQQFKAVGTEVTQMQCFSQLLIFAGQAVDRFDCGMVGQARVQEIDDHL